MNWSGAVTESDSSTTTVTVYGDMTVTANFEVITYTISGTVTGEDGVTVTLSDDTIDSQTVNDGGRYSFSITYGGSYTVTPSKAGYTFNPSYQTFSNVMSDIIRDFTAYLEIPGKIAFVSKRDGNDEIYIMDADGSNQRNITNNPGSDYSPSWSPF